MWKQLALAFVMLSGCIDFLQDDAEPIPVPEPFQLEGFDCDELLFQLTIDGGHAQDQLPDGYTAFIANGQGIAIVGLKECGDTHVDGNSIGASSTGDMGILLETQDTTFRYYQTQWFTDNLPLFDALSLQGWNAILSVEDYVNDTRLEPLGVGATEFVISAVEGMVRGEADIIGNQVPGELHAIGSYEGEFGVLRVDKVLRNSETGVGQGYVSANGEVADLLGTSYVVGTATLGAYNMSATVG